MKRRTDEWQRVMDVKMHFSTLSGITYLNQRRKRSSEMVNNKTELIYIEKVGVDFHVGAGVSFSHLRCYRFDHE